MQGTNQGIAQDWSGIEMGTPEYGLLVALSEPWAELAPRLPTEAMIELFRARRVRLGGLTEAQLAALPIDELVAHVREFDFTGGLDEEVARIFAAVARAPAATLAELWLAGRAPDTVLTDEVIALVPIDALVRALREDALGWMHADDAGRFCAAHPALGSVEASLDLLARVGDVDAHAARAFTTHLVRVVTAQRHAAAVPVLRRLRSSAGGSADLFTDALFRLGDAETLDEVAATLAPTVQRIRPRWDPHHTTPELREPVRAVFARARERSAAAFAPYFTKAALASEKGAKVALDILLLGQGTIVDHDGTVLRKPGEDWLSLDPGWQDVLAGLGAHPRLGPTAKRLLRRLGASAASPRSAR
jgi:hypothetical protein